MSRNVNEVRLLGNVTATPELKNTRSGTMVTNFSVATNESYKDANDEWQERAQYHNCTAWGKQAEVICQHVKKGQQVFIAGSMNYGSYEKEVEGVEVTIPTAEVKVQRCIFIGGKPGNQSDDSQDEDFDGHVPDDDLPF